MTFCGFLWNRPTIFSEEKIGFLSKHNFVTMITVFVDFCDKVPVIWLGDDVFG